MTHDTRLSSSRALVRSFVFAVTAMAGVSLLACSSDDSPSDPVDAAVDAPPKCAPTVLSGGTYDPGTATCPEGCNFPYSTRPDLYRVCSMLCSDDKECPNGYFCFPTGVQDQKACILSCTPAISCPNPTECPKDATYPARCH